MFNRIREEMGKYSKPERLFEPEECPKSRFILSGLSPQIKTPEHFQHLFSDCIFFLTL